MTTSFWNESPKIGLFDDNTGTHTHTHTHGNSWPIANSLALAWRRSANKNCFVRHDVLMTSNWTPRVTVYACVRITFRTFRRHIPR